MRAAIEHFELSLFVVYMLSAIPLLFLDAAQKRDRLLGILGVPGAWQPTWEGPASRLCYAFVYMGWLVCTVIKDFAERSPRHQVEPSWTLSDKVFLVSFSALFVALVFTSIWSRKDSAKLEEFRVSRGQLYTSFSRLTRKLRLGRFWLPLMHVSGHPLYVLPDSQLASARKYIGNGVLLPRSLLNLLSKEEIDALAARQLCRQSTTFYLPMVLPLVGFDSIAVFAARWLHAGLLLGVGGSVAVIAVQLFVLNCLLPGMLLRADLRAAHIAQSPAIMISALAGIARFHHIPPPDSLIRAIALENELPSAQIHMLAAERCVFPQDRYLTTGSYMDTGL